MASNAAVDMSINIESQNREIEIGIVRNTKNMAMSIERGSSQYPIYQGPYEVVPRLYWGKTLQTRNKSMIDNVNVAPITVYEVENPAGGKTITIGTI